MGNKFSTFKTSFKIIHQNIQIVNGIIGFKESNETKTIRHRDTRARENFLNAGEQFRIDLQEICTISLICFPIDHANLAMAKAPLRSIL